MTSNSETNLSSSSSPDSIPLAQRMPREDEPVGNEFLRNLRESNPAATGLIDSYIESYLHGGGFPHIADQLSADMNRTSGGQSSAFIPPDLVKATRTLVHEFTRQDVLFGKPLSYSDCTSGRLLIPSEVQHYFPNTAGSAVEMREFKGERIRDFTIFVSPTGQIFFDNGWQSYVDDHGIMYRNKPQILVAQDHWDRFTIYCFYSSSPLPELFYPDNPPPPPPPHPHPHPPPPTPPSQIPTSNTSFFPQTHTTRESEGGGYSGAPQGPRVSSAGQWSRPLKRSKNKYLGSELCMVFPKLVPSTNFSNLCLASLQGGIILLFCGTSQLFLHLHYVNGAATSSDFAVHAYTATRVKKALEVTHYPGRKIYLLWGGRKGYQTHQLARKVDFEVMENKVIEWEELQIPSAKQVKELPSPVVFEMLDSIARGLRNVMLIEAGNADFEVMENKVIELEIPSAKQVKELPSPEGEQEVACA